MAEQTTAKALNTDRQLSSTEIFDILMELVKIKRPAMIWGQPGIGKSELVEQVAKKLGRKFIDVRLLLMDPTDLRGIPYKNSNDEMVWAPAVMFPRDPDDTSIILLDEITAAPPSVQAAALQLVLNRRIGEYVLPDGVSIIAAGNRETDKTYVNRMPSALANRFIHLEMTFNFDAWRDWAFDKGIHKDVLGFISAFPQKANTFDPKSNSKIFATPRTWTFVSEILDSGMSEELKMESIAGTVGQGVMFEFRRHRKLSEDLPKAEDIFSGKIEKLTKSAKENISLQHALMTSLVYKIREYHAAVTKKDESGEFDTKKNLSQTEWNKIIANFMKFLENPDNFETEIAVMGMTILYKRYNITFRGADIPEVRAFFKKYAKLLQFIF